MGVSLIAVLLVVSAGLTIYRALTPPGARLGPKFLAFSVVLSILALVAAEALWTLRSHAFLMFMLWCLCSMAVMVLTRLPLASSGHGIRLMGPIVYVGLGYALAAVYLRRAV